MSRVYFHTLQGTASIPGSERAHAAAFAEEAGARLLAPHARQLGLDSHYYERPGIFRVAAGEGELTIQATGERVDCWQAMLNTALKDGSDALAFLARMHAQCELHCWVADEDRGWLAGVIRGGLAEGTMRADAGWDRIVALLESSADGPAVLSYSGGESFPRPGLWDENVPGVDEDGELIWKPRRPEGDDAYADAYDDWIDEVDDLWDGLLKASQFNVCRPSISHMRFGPNTLRTPFGHCLTAQDVVDKLCTPTSNAQKALATAPT